MKKIIFAIFSLILIVFLASCDTTKEPDLPPAPPEPEDNLIVLATPVIELKDNVVSWGKVEHADGYIVNLNGTDLEAQSTKEYAITASEAGDYIVKVKACI